MGQKIDFVYVIATMPGRHSADQVHKVKEAAAPSFLFYGCRCDVCSRQGQRYTDLGALGYDDLDFGYTVDAVGRVPQVTMGTPC